MGVGVQKDLVFFYTERPQKVMSKPLTILRGDGRPPLTIMRSARPPPDTSSEETDASSAETDSIVDSRSSTEIDAEAQKEEHRLNLYRDGDVATAICQDLKKCGHWGTADSAPHPMLELFHVNRVLEVMDKHGRVDFMGFWSNTKGHFVNPYTWGEKQETLVRVFEITTYADYAAYDWEAGGIEVVVPPGVRHCVFEFKCPPTADSASDVYEKFNGHLYILPDGVLIGHKSDEVFIKVQVGYVVGSEDEIFEEAIEERAGKRAREDEAEESEEEDPDEVMLLS